MAHHIMICMLYEDIVQALEVRGVHRIRLDVYNPTIG
jgi:hypothetical protein